MLRGLGCGLYRLGPLLNMVLLVENFCLRCSKSPDPAVRFPFGSLVGSLFSLKIHLVERRFAVSVCNFWRPVGFLPKTGTLVVDIEALKCDFYLGSGLNSPWKTASHKGIRDSVERSAEGNRRNIRLNLFSSSTRNAPSFIFLSAVSRQHSRSE